jgi:transposase
MTKKRRVFTAEFKAQAVLDMLTHGKSAAEASREYGIKDGVLSRWQREFIERAPRLFHVEAAGNGDEQRIAELERLVGRLTMELDLVKKVSRQLS